MCSILVNCVLFWSLLSRFDVGLMLFVVSIFERRYLFVFLGVGSVGRDMLVWGMVYFLLGLMFFFWGVLIDFLLNGFLFLLFFLSVWSLVFFGFLGVLLGIGFCLGKIGVKSGCDLVI